jgi:hypothetical protein
MLHNIIDLLIALGVWINTYINIHNYMAKKKKGI